MGLTSSAPAYDWPDKVCKEADGKSLTMRATLGAGCYWGTENYVQKWGKRDGRAVATRVGFSGGKDANPSYRDVCTGSTGHVEVLEVDLADPKGAGPAAVYEDLLKYFFMFHDPTTLNRQGNDAGTQYASVIFVHDEEQRRIANKVKAELQSLVSSGKVKGYSGKTVTTAVVAAGPFYLAQKAHQDYLNQNPDGYCNHRLRFKAWPEA